MTTEPKQTHRWSPAAVLRAARRVADATVYCSPPSAPHPHRWQVRSLAHGGILSTAGSAFAAERQRLRFGIDKLRLAKILPGVRAECERILSVKE